MKPYLWSFGKKRYIPRSGFDYITILCHEYGKVNTIHGIRKIPQAFITLYELFPSIH